VLRAAVLAGGRGNGEQPAPAPAKAPAPSEAADSWLLATLARLIRRRPEELRAGDRLVDLGVDSLTRMELLGALEARSGRRLDPATIAGLVRVQDLIELG